MTTAELPHNLDAEKATLGSVLMVQDRIVEIANWLKPDMFYSRRHAEIYAAMLHLFSQRIPADTRTVSDELRRRGQLDKIGGRLASETSDVYLGLGDVIDITSGDPRALQEVQDRECRDLTEFARQACNQSVIGSAQMKAAYFESQYMQTLGALRLLLQSLGYFCDCA